MDRLHDRVKGFSYYNAILRYANYIRTEVIILTDDFDIEITSVTLDPYTKDGSYLQHNPQVVKHVFKLFITNYLIASKTKTTDELNALLYNILLKVYETEHDFTLTESDLQLCNHLCDYLFKFRTKLVNIGEHEIVGDLFANILARVHITLELIKMIEDMKKEEAIRMAEYINEKAEL